MSARTSPVIAFGAAALGIAIYSVMDTLMKLSLIHISEPTRPY